MRNFDLSPLYRATVGFDQLAEMMDRVLEKDVSRETYPPYNIERAGDDSYRISLALAGFSPDEVSVVAEQNVLTVEGRKTERACTSTSTRVSLRVRSGGSSIWPNTSR